VVAFSRYLKLRLSDDLTDDARFNLERIDELGAVFPSGESANQSIESSGAIYLNANSVSLGGDGNGDVLAPNLKLSNSLSIDSGAFTLTIKPGSLTSNFTLTLPEGPGDPDQFLSTDGNGTTSWADPPNTNLSSLNDTTFTNLQSGQFIQYNGSSWSNVELPASRLSGVFTWAAGDNNYKTIVHNFNTENIQVWVYDATDKTQVLIEGIDILDLNTIFLTAHSSPDNDYIVHIFQTV
jgi:hypothetical protein